MLKKFCKNWTDVVTLVGVIAVFIIIFSGVEPMYVLLVLGAMNCLYGLYAVITKKPIMKAMELAGKTDSPNYNMGMGICQLSMGLFILIMGIIYISDIAVGKYFWDIILVGIVIIMICWNVIRYKARK